MYFFMFLALIDPSGDPATPNECNGDVTTAIGFEAANLSGFIDLRADPT
jgi:hypothetical protein